MPLAEDEMVACCIDCDSPLGLDDADLGEVISCPECGLEMEIIGTDPVTLDLVREELEMTNEEDFTEA